METAAGNTYEYDELVVATGSNAARLPIPGAEHTHVYRTLEDVWAINKAITELTEKLGRKVNAVTIGGGLLGPRIRRRHGTAGRHPDRHRRFAVADGHAAR